MERDESINAGGGGKQCRKSERKKERTQREGEIEEGRDRERDRWLINSFHYPVAATE